MADDTGQEQKREKEELTFRDKARKAFMGSRLRGPFSSADLDDASEEHPAFDIGMRRGWGEGI